jgi:nucleotide-binding universal stress UspA family protein
VKAEMTGPITWFVNSHGLLEKLLGDWDQVSPQPITIPTFPAVNGDSNGHRFKGEEKTVPLMSSHEADEVVRKPVILVPFENSHDSLQAAKVGISIARHVRGQLVLCKSFAPRVIPFGPANPPWVGEALRTELVTRMSPVLKMATEAGVAATCEIHEGTPTGVILKVAHRRDADLIVLTAERQGIWSRLLFGSHTTEEVIDKAECHVMVLRNL